jgi:hypothetical protein
MTYQLAGTPSDELPAVLATGSTEVRAIFASMSAREPSGRDADYFVWHSMDHRPEQFRIAGIRHSIRLVSTPACRAARLRSEPRFDPIDHVMTYFLTGDAAFDKFWDLSEALSGERRPFRLQSVYAAYFWLAGKVAARRAIAGADVIPWRPARGVFLLVEEGDATPASLVETSGVAGVWWYKGGNPPMEQFVDNTGIQVSYLFVDDDPVETAVRLREPLEDRWSKSGVRPLLAAPFYQLVPFEWDRYLP